jgi:formate hydrogenlyase subunit 3/multisubunit Na+/H+ antiporter MnhD subunit
MPLAAQWMVWSILLPLAGAAIFFLLKERHHAIIIIISLLTLLSTAGLAFNVWETGSQFHYAGGWQPPLGIVLYADGMSILMMLMTALVGLSISLYALRYFSDKRSLKFFLPLWFFLWASLNALFLSGDIFNIYVTLELLSLSAVALVTVSSQQDTSQRRDAVFAGMRYLLISMLGSLCYLLGVALLYAGYGVLDLKLLSEVIAPSPSVFAAITFITIGLLIKTALFPLHFWLPPAHANAPAPVSAVLSGLVVKASFYLLVRLWFGVFSFALSSESGLFFGLLGASGILWGSFFALRQKTIKMLIAYSTVAQIGYMFLLFPLAADMPSLWGAMAMNAGIYHLISHAFAKSSLFLCSGNIILAFGHNRIDGIGGIAKHYPLTFSALGLSGLGIIGLPISGGFIAKWQFLTAFIGSGQWWWAVIIITGSLMAAVYIYIIWSRIFAPLENDIVLNPVPKSMEILALFLSLISIFMGLTAEPVLQMLHIGRHF